MDDKRFQEIKNRSYLRKFVSPFDTALVLTDVEELINTLEEAWDKNKLLIAEVEEHNCACGDALDSLWKEILINHPDYGDWTYPGEAYRHIKAEFDDLRKQLVQTQEMGLQQIDDHKADLELQKRVLGNQIATLRKQLDVSHAVNKVALHTVEIQNVTIDLMKDDDK